MHSISKSLKGDMLRKAGALCLVLLLSACETYDIGPKAGIGAAAGAAGGGLLAVALGGHEAGIASGVLLGGLLGGALGSALDAQDRKIASQNAHQSLEYRPSGTSSTWRNPDSGHYGTFTPTRTYQQSDGGYCREYQQSVNVSGRSQQGYGTACRQPDGTWKVIN